MNPVDALLTELRLLDWCREKWARDNALLDSGLSVLERQAIDLLEKETAP